MIKIEKGDGEVLIVVDCDGEKQEIMFSDVAKYWTTGQRQLVGGLGAFVQEPYVVCWVTHADGANGAVFIWDTKKKKIVHASEGSYVRKALLAGNMVFSLRELPRPDISELVLCMSPAPNLDAVSKPKVAMIKLDIKIFDKKFNIDNYKLAVKDGCIYAGFRNEVKKVKFSLEKKDQGDKPERPEIPS